MGVNIMTHVTAHYNVLVRLPAFLKWAMRALSSVSPVFDIARFDTRFMFTLARKHLRLPSTYILIRSTGSVHTEFAWYCAISICS